jgi:peptidyl-prolyl cis-trans isomerase D
MMHQMRENMKVIMIITSAAFVGLMVFGWGMDITGRNTRGNQLGKVNGQSVTLDQFNVAYRNLYEQQQKAQKGAVSATVNKQIQDAAWNQLVMQILVAQELGRRGITVTPAEIKTAAKFAPPPEFAQNALFQTNGQFDLNKYQQFLASPAVDNNLLMQLEAYYRDIIPRSKLYYQVTSGLYTPDDVMWRMWRDENEKVKIRFVALDPNLLVPDASVQVTPQEISAYYDSHADEFKRPARASARVIALEKAPNAADTAAARATTLAIRDSLVSGVSFAELARRHSADETSGKNGGDLGVVKKGQTVPAFEQAAFSLPINKISDPVLSQFGYHIIQVIKKVSDDQVEARHILIPIKISQEHDDQLLARADSIEKLTATQPLPNVAIALGLNMRTVDLTQDLPRVPGVGEIDEGLDWVFGEAKPKDISQLFETPAMYYILELLNKTPAGKLSLQDATPYIKGKLATQKKIEQAKTVGNKMAADIQAGQTLDQVAAAHRLTVQSAGPFPRTQFVPGLGRTDAAIGTAFGLPEGKTSGVVQTPNGLFIIQTIEHQKADKALFDQQRQFLRARLNAQLAEQHWNQFLVALREQAKIVDNRNDILNRKPTDAQALADAQAGLPAAR